jgi:hypothetical protein
MEHTPLATLAQHLAAATILIPVGSHYAHYKHPETLYVVQGFVIIEATEEVAVIYALENTPAVTFSRPLTSWLDTVEHDGKMTPRFLKK